MEETIGRYVPYAMVAVPLGIALGLSLTIERTLELFSNIADYFHFNNLKTKIPAPDETNTAVEEYLKRQDYSEKRRLAEIELENKIKTLNKKIEKETDPKKLKDLQTERASIEQSFDYDEKHHGPRVLIQEATDPNEVSTMKHFLMHLWGFALGIILAHFANLNLFGALFKASGAGTISPSLDNILTGLLIGAGSAPIHFLIGFISERKITIPKNLDTTDKTERVSEKNNTEEIITSAPVGAVPIITTGSAWSWKDIAYSGGVDTVLLESIHKRPSKPDSIFYHHTAMSCNSTFDDVVRTIKDRTDKNGNHWVTGYHCVIIADGTICPFCRWDRYGNQATGYNLTSLGISFNGNYETDPKVPFSNPDGRFGSPHPTEVQLDSGARVVALWALLYDIPLDFSTAIRPHNAVANKTCPGSQFPYEQFRTMVSGFYNNWKSTSSVIEKINQFKLKPYIMDKDWR